MAARVFLGVLSKQGLPTEAMNCITRIGRQYYRTAQKVDKVSHKKTSMTNQECLSHNNNIPSYEEVKSSPVLQKRLAQMYKKLAKDSDFNEVTIDSMKWGARSIVREKVS